jgi:hypothetical protein
MLREVLLLLGADLYQKIAEIRAQVDEFRVRTTRQVTEQVKDTALTVAYALTGTIAATATFAIVVVVLYRLRPICGARCDRSGDGVIGGIDVRACVRACRS